MITTIIRTIILYAFVTFAIRIMGKRQIGDMQPNELVITLLISEIVAIPLQDISQPILSGIVFDKAKQTLVDYFVANYDLPYGKL